MKKSLLALAVLGAFAGAAQAQSSVTIYGLIDQGIVRNSNINAAGDSKMSVGAGTQSSRWGVTGTEDLGGGMKAFFRLEGQIFADTGEIDSGTQMFKRAANLGLAGNFGTVTLGRQTDPFYIAYASGDTRASNLTGSSLQPYLRATATAVPLAGVEAGANMQQLWVNNAVSYTTPDFNGFKATAYYAFGEVAGESSASKQQGITANYAAGPLTANAGFVQHYNATGDKDGQGYTVNGGYTFGPATVRASWSSFKDPNAANEVKFDIYGLSALYAVSSTVDVSAGFYRLNDKSADAIKGDDVNMFGLEADYKLSKRTTLYAVYGRSSDGSIVGAQHSAGAGGTTFSAAEADKSQTVVGVGVRHTF
ncbi:MAG TPA: porin [Noviherbaspirillum sp.]|nr:porin [Noviherbaspirillum sp.]